MFYFCDSKIGECVCERERELLAHIFMSMECCNGYYEEIFVGILFAKLHMFVESKFVIM